MGRSWNDIPWQGRVDGVLSRHRGRGIVVAVSGGADSVGLLRVIAAARDDFDLRLSVAHLDHGTRGDAARADAEFVAALAHSLNLPFDLGQWRPSRPGHFEADARKARYEWLVEVARSRGAEIVAVGHTQDDQAETILHRILRGTGPRGLAGIPAQRVLAEGVTLIRPLLDVSRAEVRAGLAEMGQPFREDASNSDLARTRNRIRHDLLPKLAAEYNPRVAEALVRLGRLAGETRARSRPVAILAKGATESSGDGLLILRGSALLPFPLALRAEVIRRAWRIAGWPQGPMSAARWARLAASIDGPPARFSIGGGVDASFDGTLLRLGRGRAGRRPEPTPIPLAVPGWAVWGDGRIVAEPDGEGLPDDERIDLDRLEPMISTEGLPMLMVRAPRDGDRFDPLGLDGHTRSLNDVLRGRGVAKSERAEVPLVADRAGIVWVVGHRIADRVKLTAATRQVLRLGRRAIGPTGCD